MNGEPEDSLAEHTSSVPTGTARVAEALSYASGQQRTAIVLGLFCVGIFLSMLCIAVDVGQFELCANQIHGNSVSAQEFESNSRRHSGIALAMIAQSATLVVTFFMWIYRAHTNLPALRATGLEYSAKGAIGWYFAPVFNWFRPYQVMREIYNASDPNDAPNGGDDWRHYKSPALLKLWWGLFLLMNFFAGSSTRLSFDAKTPSDFQAAAAASIVSESVSIVAYLPALWLVWSINRRQSVRAAILATESIENWRPED